MELVKELCGEAWGMAAEMVAVVQQGLLIEENEYGALYGKTGTNLLDETVSRTNSWFIDWVEKDERWRTMTPRRTVIRG